MPYGWIGTILRVDLTKGKVTRESTMPYVQDWIGGRGIGSKILYDEAGPDIKPYDPENLLIFNTGPLTGTLVPGSGRGSVTSKSPLTIPTGLHCEEGIGGYWGPELKFAGYDHLVVKGRAEKPVYIFIDNEDVEIRDASDIWGKTTFETQKTVKDELGDPEIKVLSIGQAGENLVRFAIILTGLCNAAGRDGMGAVMGSKRLKAVAVHGTKEIGIAKPNKFLELAEEAYRREKEHPNFETWKREATFTNMLGEFDGGVHSFGHFEESAWPFPMEEKARAFLKEHQLKILGCFGCPIPCYNVMTVPGVSTAVAAACEQYNSFVKTTWNSDIKVMWEAIMLADAYGIDAIETGNRIAFMMELYRRGVITKKDTDGVPMERGSREAIITTIHKIAKREGYGDILAEGILSAAERIGGGAEKYAIHIKGVTPHPYQYQAYKGAALEVAVGAFYMVFDNLWMEEIEYIANPEFATKLSIARYGSEKAVIPSEYGRSKVAACIISEHEGRVIDMLGVCLNHVALLPYRLPLEKYVDFFRIATGINMDMKTLLGIGERVLNLERAFDVREGICRQKDALPNRFFEPLPSGIHKGKKIDKAQFEKMKNEYYQLRDWDVETGIPTKKKLAELGLEYVANHMEKIKLSI